MDSAKLIFNQVMTPPKILDAQAGSKKGLDSDKEKFAKDFESVFISKLLDEMKNSIGNWDEEKDSSGEQIDGLFYIKLAEELSDKGGIGMWKDIYQQITNMEQNNSGTNLLDKNL